jgi:hypothetical protein
VLPESLGLTRPLTSELLSSLLLELRSNKQGATARESVHRSGREPCDHEDAELEDRIHFESWGG